jgi:dolichyl-phosphate-mannose-protein mannosyltransferase
MELSIEHVVDVEIAKRLFNKLYKWEHIGLILIIVVTFALHLVIIDRPALPLFDEHHYVTDARVIIQQHDSMRTEHPPLSKLLIVSGIYIFGDNQWGWRLPSVIIGTLGVVFFYLMCRRFKLSLRAANIATFLLATENLYFIHSSIAMLDIFAVSFMLMAFWLYARRDYGFAGIAIALATLCKFNGLFAVIPIILHWLIFRRDKQVNFVASLLLSGISFFFLYTALESVIHLRWIDFVTAFKSLEYGLSQTASLTFITATHPSMSRPWEWVFNLEIMPYYNGPHYEGLISFSIWALIIPTLIYTAVKALRKDEAGLFSVAWFIGTYLIWIPMSLITNRVSFIFYYLPTVGTTCLGLGMGLDRLINYWQGRKQFRVKASMMPEGVTSIPDVVAGPAPAPTPTVFYSESSMAPAESAAIAVAVPRVRRLQPVWNFIDRFLAAMQAPKRRIGLRWAAFGFVVLVILVQVATFVIVTPSLNNWPIENWFK